MRRVRRGEARDQPQAVGDLLFAQLPERPAQFQRRQHFGPPAEEQLDVVREVVGFIEVPADQHDRPMELLLHSGDDGGDAAAPQPGRGRGARSARDRAELFSSRAATSRPRDFGRVLLMSRQY